MNGWEKLWKTRMKEYARRKIAVSKFMEIKTPKTSFGGLGFFCFSFVKMVGYLFNYTLHPNTVSFYFWLKKKRKRGKDNNAEHTQIVGISNILKGTLARVKSYCPQDTLRSTLVGTSPITFTWTHLWCKKVMDLNVLLHDLVLRIYDALLWKLKCFVSLALIIWDFMVSIVCVMGFVKFKIYS